MAGGRRAANRQHQSTNRSRIVQNHPSGSMSSNQDGTASTVKNGNLENVTLLPVCHPAIPDLQCLSNMMFETIFLLYLHIALFCQYIYLYKTVWWYPVTLPPSTTSLSFHLIDRNLTFFLTVFLSRRLIWSLLWDFLRPRSDNTPGLLMWILVCFFMGIIWVCFLIGPLVYLYYSTSLLNMLILCYPILLWMPLTGMSGDSCLTLVLTWASIGDINSSLTVVVQEPAEDGSASSGVRKQTVDPPMARLLDSPETTGDLRTSYANLGNALDAQQVREEVRLLCRDFNSRISEIVFCSMVCAYYVGLVPMFFMKSNQYYDMGWCLQHTVLVLFNSFALLSSQLLHPQYLHVLHKCATLLGGYKIEPSKDTRSVSANEDNRLESGSLQDPDVHDWSPYTVFSPGTKVRYKGKLYTSTGKHNAAEPDDSTHARFFYMFNNPLRIINCHLIGQSIVVMFQIQLLITSSKWDHLISVALLQFFSYYVLFRTLRDRIVLGRAYALHEQIYRQSRD